MFQSEPITGPRGGGGGVLISNLSISQGPPPEARGKPRIWAFQKTSSEPSGVFGGHAPGFSEEVTAHTDTAQSYVVSWIISASPLRRVGAPLVLCCTPHYSRQLNYTFFVEGWMEMVARKLPNSTQPGIWARFTRVVRLKHVGSDPTVLHGKHAAPTLCIRIYSL